MRKFGADERRSRFWECPHEAQKLVIALAWTTVLADGLRPVGVHHTARRAAPQTSRRDGSGDLTVSTRKHSFVHVVDVENTIQYSRLVPRKLTAFYRQNTGIWRLAVRPTRLVHIRDGQARDAAQFPRENIFPLPSEPMSIKRCPELKAPHVPSPQCRSAARVFRSTRAYHASSPCPRGARLRQARARLPRQSCPRI